MLARNRRSNRTSLCKYLQSSAMQINHGFLCDLILILGTLKRVLQELLELHTSARGLGAKPVSLEGPKSYNGVRCPYCRARPFIFRDCERGRALLTQDTRPVLHCCTFAEYMHVPSIPSVQLGCNVGVQRGPLQATPHVYRACCRVLYSTVPDRARG